VLITLAMHQMARKSCCFSFQTMKYSFFFPDVDVLSIPISRKPAYSYMKNSAPGLFKFTMRGNTLDYFENYIFKFSSRHIKKK
jgi:hypothetical protein